MAYVRSCICRMDRTRLPNLDENLREKIENLKRMIEKMQQKKLALTHAHFR